MCNRIVINKMNIHQDGERIGYWTNGDGMKIDKRIYVYMWLTQFIIERWKSHEK